MFSLSEKSAIVTGGSSGIGRAIARQFAAAGARVFVADLRPPPDGFAFLETDVSREEDVEAMFLEARRRNGKVDVLVNNAGIQPLGVGFEDLTPPLLDRTLAVNVGGVAFGIKHGARELSSGGRVINLASFVGTIATPGAAAYAASKAAVLHLTRLGAIELAPRGITVNAVSPGTIRTPAVTQIPENPEIPFIEGRAPLGRLGEAGEVAWLCHFLASDEAAYITGQNIGIDGGLTAGWTEYPLAAPANVRDGRWVDDP
jgi:NAD(P)-dependent dehydrogenase (short-subunit alcohol dehydrogenase family)